jgi:hypothetical protein
MMPSRRRRKEEEGGGRRRKEEEGGGRRRKEAYTSSQLATLDIHTATHSLHTQPSHTK